MLELDRATRISIAEFQEAQHLEHKRLLYEIVEQVKEEARIVEKEIRSALPNNLSEAEHAAEETQLLMIKKLEDLCSKKKSEIQTIRESRKNQGKTNQASDASHNPFELPTRMTATGTIPRTTNPGTFSDLPATNSCMLSSFSISNPTSVPSWSPTLIFNEIISATFRKHANPDYKLTIHGYMSLYFPTNTVVDLDSIKMGSFVFRLRNLDKVSFCADNHSSAFIPHSMTFDDISKQSEGIDNTIFTIEGRDILSALRKMVRRNQRAPYHRVTIFSYEIKDSQTGEVSLDFCPLTLYTEWVQGVFGTTKLSVKYKCNPSILKLDSIIYLRDVQITVEIDGHYTMLRSEPQARKSIDSNGICWTFPTLLGNSFGELTASFHTLSASQYGKVKATFNCEGSTLSGIEFELHDKNICPIRTTKRRFKSGIFIYQASAEVDTSNEKRKRSSGRKHFGKHGDMNFPSSTNTSPDRNLDWCSPPNAKTPITPLPLMQPRFIPPPMGSRFGPTILLNEIINADFLVHHKLREQLVIYGYLSLDFTPDAAKMLINSRTPVGDFIFRLKNTKNVKKLHPMQKNQLNVRNHPSGGKFLKKDESLIIRIPDMVSALQKMRVDDPEAPLLRLPVLKYDVDSLKGISSCPLSLDVNWVLKDPIQVTIGYKCNPDVVHTKLENIEISVEMDDPFDNYNAKPKANRPGKENLIVWKFPLLKPGHFGELKAYFESDDSDLDPGKVKASFDCLSANISGLEIEVPPFSQFPVKALVKKFKADHYEMCVVCFEVDPSYLFKPCRHRCLCEDCAVNKYADREKFTTCPVCCEEFDAIEMDVSAAPAESVDSLSEPDHAFEDEEEELAMALKLSLQQWENAEELQIAELLEFDRVTRISIAEFQETQILEHKHLLYAIVEQVKAEARNIERDIQRSLPNNMTEAEFAAEEIQLRMIQKVEDVCRKRRLAIQTNRESRKNQEPNKKTDSRFEAAIPYLMSNLPSSSIAAAVPRWSPTLIINEIVSATFQTGSKPDCKLKIHGFISLYFQTNIVADIDSVKMDSFDFRLRNYDHLRFSTEDRPLERYTIYPDGEAKDILDNAKYSFNGSNIISVLKRMVKNKVNPKAPFYRVTVMSYEVEDPQTKSVNPEFCPLTLSAEWSDDDSESTILVVKYKCNSNILRSDAFIFLRNIQISVQFKEDFTLINSEPKAIKSDVSKEIRWNLAPLRGNASSELMASFNGVSAGKYGIVKAKFDCEGTTLSGFEFEIDESNTCPVRHIKKRFKSDSSVECVTCSESNPSCFFKPCNHKCICPKCAKKYYIGKSEKQTCPICRQRYSAIGHDDSKPKNQSMDEDEQLAIALRISLQESLEQEAKRKLEESDANRQDNPAVVDLRIKQESELLEHKRILSSIVDLVSREASKIEMGLLQSFPVDIRGAQFAREETELRMIQNVENAFSRIKESIKLRRSIQMDLWKECPESLQKLTGQTGIQGPIQEITRPTGFNPLENVRSPQGSSNEGVSSTQSSQAASSTEKSYANLVKTSPIKTRPASEMSKTSSMSDLRLVRGVSTEALSFQPLASITFNEIIDVIVTDEDESYMHVRPHGFMSLYLPSKLAMSIAVTDKRMQKFTFQVRKSDFIENFIISDGLLTEL
ncbi:hypothetical protein QAD02_006123, partial [Eretmocerus hayati]